MSNRHGASGLATADPTTGPAGGGGPHAAASPLGDAAAASLLAAVADLWSLDEPFADAAAAVGALLCRHLGATAVRLWLRDAVGDGFVSAESWPGPAGGPDTTDRRSAGADDDALAAAVRAGGAPVLGPLDAVPLGRRRRRAARAAGASFAVGWPLVVAGEVVGVLEILSRAPLPLDGPAGDLLRGAGAVLGLAVARQQDAARLRVHERRIAALAAERAAAEAGLRENRRLVDRIADAIPAILYLFDLRENRNVFCNRAVADILGHSPEEVARLGDAVIATLAHPDDIAVIHSTWADLDAAADGTVVECEYRMRHANGDWRWLTSREVVLSRDADGAARLVVGVSTDATARKRTEAALREAGDRFAEATAAAKIAVWSCHIAEGVVRTEPPLATLLGFPPGAAGTPSRWIDFVHPDDRARMADLAARMTGPANAGRAGERVVLPEVEYRLRGPGGAVRWVADRGTLFRGADGRPERAVGTVIDVTARKLAEEELRALSGQLLRAQDEERRRIAADLHDGVAQDLATIAIDLLRLERVAPALPAAARAALGSARDLTERALRETRTRSYLLHPPLLDETGLGDALGWFVDGFVGRSGIAVALDTPDDLGRLPADIETALFRVVQECLTNVQRHSGSLSATVRLRRGPDGVELTVRDRGRGLPDRKGRAAGAPAEATGVGIAAMRERLARFGGRLHVSSAGGGTTVTAVVPEAVIRGADGGATAWRKRPSSWRTTTTSSGADSAT